MHYLAALIIFFSINCYGGIGTITEGNGNSEILRKKDTINAKLNTGIEPMDTVVTANGIVGMTFIDNTKIRVTQHSKLIIDDFVYDTKSKGSSKLVMRIALGTVRYASGNIAHNNPNSVGISTPTATVAVRGTAFTMTVDEIGQSLIILLPNKDGTVGEIEVSTSMGSVVLNQAFQATVTTANEVKPMKPAILNLSESMINNMLIVKPPKEVIRRMMEDNNNNKNDFLVFTELDKNALEIKSGQDVLGFVELDINELNADYLGNALDSLLITEFKVGYNPSTQIYVLDNGQNWQVDRHVKGDITIIISKDKGYNISILQNEALVSLKNMEDTTNKIIIKQTAR